MHKLTDKQYNEYKRMLRDRDAGRILTTDGLRMICSAHEYDPEKIGLHFLTVLANWNKVEVWYVQILRRFVCWRNTTDCAG